MAEKDNGCDSSPPPPPLPAAGEMKKRKSTFYENEEIEEGEFVPSDFAGEDEDDDDEMNVKTIGNAVRVSGNEDDSRRFHFNGFEANGISYQLVSCHYSLFIYC